MVVLKKNAESTTDSNSSHKVISSNDLSSTNRLSGMKDRHSQGHLLSHFGNEAINIRT